MWQQDSHNTSGFFQTNNVDSPSAKKPGDGAPRRAQNVFPVCVRQLRDCTDDGFTVFDMEMQILTLVCLVRDYNVSSTKVTYTIEDHTASIQALLWLESDKQENIQVPEVTEGRYARFFGSFRCTDGNKHLLILKMIPISNPNEVTTHLLEVIHARFAMERMMSEGKSSASIAQNNPGGELANEMKNTFSDSSNTNSNFTPLQAKIYDIIKPDMSTNGVSSDFLFNKFPPSLHNDIKKALDYLSSEGHIYSTIDVNHFKAT